VNAKGVIAMLLNDEARAMIGVETGAETACDPVESGAVRRFAQACMDDDPDYRRNASDGNRYGGPIAPPLFPLHYFRRPLGTPDPITERALDPDFDGIVGSTSQGLPELPLRGLALLNGGLEVELFRYARHGEAVTAKSRYADITERQTRKGPMVFVVIETEYRTGEGELLVRARKTLIRR
jgi:hypothetical protein